METRKDRDNPATRPGEGAEQPAQPVPQPPRLVFRLSQDSLEMEMTLERVSTLTAPPVYEDILGELTQQGVVYGICTETIQQLCQRPGFNRPYVVAKGVAPQRGEDGFLRYLISTTKDLRPKLREDGTVDFRDLGYVQNVRAGQPLCEVHPPTQGKDGTNVFGNLLAGSPGREVAAPLGKNTALNDDRTLVVASCDGNAEVNAGIISVNNVMRIAGNVDNSTGDIHFVGDIVIAGDVVSGFHVTSEGSIVVSGSVEGATVEAVGDVTVQHGINGMQRGSIVAGGNVKCKYIQSCHIKSGENIYADSIMYCTVECGGNMELSGKKGALIGGRTSITGMLSAKSIGTEAHIATQVMMCSTNMVREQEVQQLKQQIKALDAEQLKLMQLMARYDDLLKKGRLDKSLADTIPLVKNSYLQAVQKRRTLATSLEETQKIQLIESAQNSFILCSGRIHSGVKISFGPAVFQVQQSVVKSRVFLDEGEVKLAPM